MSLDLIPFVIPTWQPGSLGYAITLSVSALIAILILLLCLVKALKNPGFMRDDVRKKTAQIDLPKAVSIASSSCEKLVGTPLKIFTPFTKNSGI